MIIDSNTGIYSGGKGKSTTVNGSKDTGVAKSGVATLEPNNSRADVSLSNQGVTLSRLAQNINETPDVNQAKVEQIREAIANGSFEINADRIAEKMLNQDDLLGS